MRIQIFSAIFTSIFNVILSIYLIKIIGISGAVFGSVIAWLFFTLIPYSVKVTGLFHKHGSLTNAE